jgi:hypothetical protein
VLPYSDFCMRPVGWASLTSLAQRLGTGGFVPA